MSIKGMVRGAYDLQKLRIQTGLRLVATVKVKLGQAPGRKEKELDADAKKILNELRTDYRRFTDGVAAKSGSRSLPVFESFGVIDSLSEFALVDSYFRLVDDEDRQFFYISEALKEFPIYNKFLKGVKGVGPAMSGVIVSEIDIAKAHRISGLWKYAGVDVAEDGKGRSRKAEHLVEKEYVNKDGEPATRKGITFNPFLKTKLLGVLGPCLLRAGEPKYSNIYKQYKHRLENHITYKDVSKGHRHNMAMRYMVKMFLIDLWTTWRTLEKLPVSKTYQEEKLGMKHAA
jgi:hypothetical protein